MESYDEFRLKKNIGKPYPQEDEKFSTKRLRGVVKHGNIYLDRKGLFNKPQDCPVSLKIPQTPIEIKDFIESIEWLFTKEGFNSSKYCEISKRRKV